MKRPLELKRGLRGTFEEEAAGCANQRTVSLFVPR